MCWEDYVIGHATQVKSDSYSYLAASVTKILTPNSQRAFVMFGTPTSQVWIGNANNVNSGRGFLLSGTSPPVSFTIRDDGDTPSQAWYMRAASADGTIEVWQGLLDVNVFDLRRAREWWITRRPTLDLTSLPRR